MIETLRLKWHLLDRYFRGALTPEDANAIRRWAEGRASRRKLLALLQSTWEATRVVPQRYDPEAGWQAIRARMSERPITRLPVSRRVRTYGGQERRVRRTVWLGAAAAAAIVGVVGARKFLATDRPPMASTAASREYTTVRGQRGTIELSDGTRAWLNVDSRLRIPADYGASRRDVYVEGEAMFLVEHDAARPFVVRTTGAAVEDIGTEFVVRSYPEDSSTVVIVVSGAVNVRPGSDGAGHAVALVRGQLARVDRSAFVTVENDVDVGAYHGWTQGRLQFREVPLARVAQTLERWYDIEITLADTTLETTPITATFVDQPVEDVVRIIARSIGGRYTRVGRTISLSAPANMGTPQQ